MVLNLILALAAHSEPLQLKPKADINFSGAQAIVDIDPTDGPMRPVPPDAFRYCEVYASPKARLSTLSPDSTLVESKAAETTTGGNILVTTFFFRDSVSRSPLKILCLRSASAVRQKDGFDDFREALSSIFNVVEPKGVLAAKTQE